jgi:hypothetical protein
MSPVIVAVIGALLGVAAVYVAARRSAVQPVGVDVAAEVALIAGVLEDPSLYRLVAVLEADDFAVEGHRAIWARLGELAVDDDDEAHQLEAQQLGVPCRRLELSGDELRMVLSDEGLGDAVVDTVDAVARDRDALLAAGQSIQTCSGDRAMTGLVPPVRGEVPDRPLVRVVGRVGAARVALTALGCAIAGWLIASAGASSWALAAGMVLVAGSAVCALVDLDTLYIDVPVLVVTGVLASVLSVVSVLDDWWPSVRTGLIVVVVVVGALELTALVWGKVRHSVGLGGGDGMLLLPVLFVPVVATGRWQAGVWGLITALVLTIVGQITLIVLGRTSRDEPFAWGPYLVAGWPVGWYLAAAVGAL